MALPDPQPGLVFRYEYLWADEASAGLETAVKERPACIVLASEPRLEGVRVVIVAIAHARPADDTPAIELSDRLKKRFVSGRLFAKYVYRGLTQYSGKTAAVLDLLTISQDYEPLLRGFNIIDLTTAMPLLSFQSEDPYYRKTTQVSCGP